MCDSLKVIPCRYLMANIENQKLIMKYHQFSNEEIRAISKPLCHHIRVILNYLSQNRLNHYTFKLC